MGRLRMVRGRVVGMAGVPWYKRGETSELSKRAPLLCEFSGRLGGIRGVLELFSPSQVVGLENSGIITAFEYPPVQVN